jgi:hypothetical protein
MRRYDDLNEIGRPLLWTQGGDKQRDEVRLVEAEFRTHSLTVTSGFERGDAVGNHVDAIAPIAPRKQLGYLRLADRSRARRRWRHNPIPEAMVPFSFEAWAAMLDRQMGASAEGGHSTSYDMRIDTLSHYDLGPKAYPELDCAYRPHDVIPAAHVGT